MLEGDGDWVTTTTTSGAICAPNDSSHDEPHEKEDPEGSSDLDARIRMAVERGEHRLAVRWCCEHYAPSIGRTVMALLGSQSDAEEITQDTLLAAYRGFDGFAGRGSVRAWLFGIARKLCLKRLASAGRAQRKLLEVPGAGQAPSPDEHHELSQRAVVARRALQQIRPTEREALLLRYVAELPYDAIAQACNIEEAAARKRVSRALAKLQHLVEQTEES